jgi:hypothetical protein
MSSMDLIVAFVTLPIVLFIFYVIVIDPQLVIGRILPIKYSLFFKIFRNYKPTYYDQPYLCPHCGKEIESLRGKSQ